MQNDIDFIVALGTSAETPTLTEEEKEEVLNFIISKVHGRVPIVLGLGGNNTKALVDQLKTRRFDGVDAILSVVPFYNNLRKEGMIQHYSALAEASPVPIIMYNVPGHYRCKYESRNNIEVGKKYSNIVAIKRLLVILFKSNDID